MSAAKGKLTSESAGVYTKQHRDIAKILRENKTSGLAGAVFRRCYTDFTPKILNAKDADDARWLGNNYWVGDSRATQY